MAEPKTYGLTHLSVSVKDTERTKNFYQSVFDMQVMYQEKGFVQLTTPGCKDILVFEEKNDDTDGASGGIAHFGFRLKDPADIEEIAAKVVESGGIIIDKESL